MSSEAEERRGRPSLTSVSAALLLLAPIVYMLSYAPVVRVREGSDAGSDFDDLYEGLYGAQPVEYPLYRPVGWAIDNTPLRVPLFAWADVWGVRERFELRRNLRRGRFTPRGGASTVLPPISSTQEAGSPARTTAEAGGDSKSSWTQTAELTWENGSPWLFAECVSVSGDRMLVGATEEGAAYTSCSAYFFERQPDRSWAQTAKVTVSDDTESIMCKSVSVSGDRAFVGVTAIDMSNPGIGAVHVFERQTDGSWRETAKLSHPYFGASVAVLENRAIVGARGEDARGAAYIFEHQSDGAWLQIAKLTPDEDAPESSFGISVSMTRERALVGVESQHLGNGSIGASAYVFDRQLDGTWKEVARLIPSDRVDDSLLWTRVSLTASQALVGVNWSGDESVFSGAAYVFECGDDGTWRQTATLIPSSPTLGDFVVEVSLSDGRAMIGSYGYTNYSRWTESACIFEVQSDGSWQQTDQLIAGDGAGEYDFGVSVMLDGDRAFVGAPRDTEGNGILPGAVYVFER